MVLDCTPGLMEGNMRDFLRMISAIIMVYIPYRKEVPILVVGTKENSMDMVVLLITLGRFAMVYGSMANVLLN